MISLIHFAIDLVLTMLAVGLLVPVLFFLVETVTSLWPLGARPPAFDSMSTPRVAVLVPAFNEEKILAATLISVGPQLQEDDYLLVVADNCTDKTAAVAKQCGAMVVERNNDELKGKGYAISAGISYLGDFEFDVLLIIDADCLLKEGVVEQLSKAAMKYQGPVQSAYLMKPSSTGALEEQILELSFFVKNYARPLGLKRLGLPCHLTGAGMAFPWSIVKDMTVGNGSIVEDLNLGIELALMRNPAQFFPWVTVTSEFPVTRDAQNSQRKRWVHGYLQTVLPSAPKLVMSGLGRMSWPLIGLALDLSILPLALLFFLLGIGIFFGYLTTLFGGSTLPLSLFSWGLAAFLITGIVLWLRFGRNKLTPRALLFLPAFLVRRIPIYVSFLFNRQKEWIRTERDARD